MNHKKIPEVGWHFNHSYLELPQDFFTRQLPNQVRSPSLVLLNESLLKDLDLNKDALKSEEWCQFFSGNKIPNHAIPIAEAYAGHQFGHFSELGDGRAVLLGEQINLKGEHFDIQFKGSGQTPYSRRGDGRAALGPMLREYLISEYMYALKIPTTRSLAVVTTGEHVMRDQLLPGAVLTRVAQSHIRVGTFQFAATLNDIKKLKALADYAIDRHYAACKEAENPYLKFLDAVIERQANLIAHWMQIGFIHGVMNTDNMSICGETIDYGPCAFMDRYHPETVFSSIDRQGRYSYSNQPPIGQWNLARFAETLLPLLDKDPQKAVELASKSVHHFSDKFQKAWLEGMRHKIGCFNEVPNDIELIHELLTLMQKNRADYTLTFRHLSLGIISEDEIFKDSSFKRWHENWLHHIENQAEGEAASRELMLKNNPAIIPRNYLVEQSLTMAVMDKDYGPIKEFIEALLNPYVESKIYGKPLEVEDTSYQTFCGT